MFNYQFYLRLNKTKMTALTAYNVDVEADNFLRRKNLKSAK